MRSSLRCRSFPSHSRLGGRKGEINLISGNNHGTTATTAPPRRDPPSYPTTSNANPNRSIDPCGSCRRSYGASSSSSALLRGINNIRHYHNKGGPLSTSSLVRVGPASASDLSSSSGSGIRTTRASSSSSLPSSSAAHNHHHVHNESELIREGNSRRRRTTSPQPAAASSSSASASASTAPPHHPPPMGGQSPIPTSPIDLTYQRESMDRLLAYPPHTFTPETLYEVETLLQSWSLMRTIESVSYTLQLLDRIVLVEDCGGNLTSSIDVNLVNRVINNWRVVWWTYDRTQTSAVPGSDSVLAVPTPVDMFHRVRSYYQRSNSCINEKSMYLILEAAITNGDPIETSNLGQLMFDTAVELALASSSSSSLDPPSTHPILPSTDLCNLVMRAQIEPHDDKRSVGPQYHRHNDDDSDDVDNDSIPSPSRRPIDVDRGAIPSAKVDAAVRYCEYVADTMTRCNVPWNRRTYHRLIQAQTIRKSIDGAVNSERLLRTMQSEFAKGQEHVEPSYFTYVLVLKAWAESGSSDAGSRAEALFHEVKNSASELCGKHVAVFNKVLWCHVSQETVTGAKRALALLIEQEQVDGQQPNYLSYSTVLTGLSHAGLAHEAEHVLKRVPDVYLDTVLFTKVLTALAKDKRPSALGRAKSIFDRMKAIAKTNPNVTPNLYTYNVLLDCYAKCKSYDYVASEASQLFEELQARGLRPNVVTYSSLLHCWARFGLVHQALEVLRKVPNPDLHLYNIVLSAFIKFDDPRAAPWALHILRSMPNHGIDPDVYSYNSVISAFANSSNRSESTKNVRALLDELRDRYRTTRDSRYRPASVTYNAVMNAYARAHRPDDAERVLTEMFDDYLNHNNQSARPDVTSFNTVLKAIAFAKNKAGVSDRALALFQRMESMASTIPDLTPNVITYTTLVLCHGLAGFPRRAEAALRDMQAKHESGVLREGPNLKTFQTLRKAWSTSRDPDKEQHVERIQKEIEARFGTQATSRSRPVPPPASLNR